MEIKRNIELAPFTTLGIGGPADQYIEAHGEKDVADAFDYALQNRLDIFVLGGGSNVLIADEGFRGLAIHVKLRGIEYKTEGVDVIVTAAAGEDWDPFVAAMVDQDLAGVECMSGIPGYIGGTPIQNVGAYGQEVSETIVSVSCFDRATRQITELSNARCGFSYRRSIFNTTDRDRYVVLWVKYRLKRGGPPKLNYAELRNAVGEAEQSLCQVREAVLAIRRKKSMVIDPADINSRSAGSFFKNPIITEAVFAELKNLFNSDVPSFPAANTHVKIPAAWLIEKAGFEKGHRHGSVGMSESHSLALVNRGGGSAREILELKEQIQSEVRKQFNIELQTEPVFIG
ncbi:MAG: UDP-N-acetylmuramate dehydrogenase, partial [Blastocatellia bacterium]|nr:UDP-N-acetylmuramate dehydrogenase [Blastocatellia bacterium]